MAADGSDYRRYLQSMDEELTAMIAVADEREEHLLAALLCSAHDHVVQRYVELVAESGWQTTRGMRDNP